METAMREEHEGRQPGVTSEDLSGDTSPEPADREVMGEDALQTYEHPLVTVDVAIMSVRQGDLQVLLVKRKWWPYEGLWALPGGFVSKEEALEDAARRVLSEKTGVSHVYLEQLAAFGAPDRDPRARVITVVYFALLDARPLSVQPADDAASIAWSSAAHLPPLAFDHTHILHYALQRLRSKLDYTAIAFHLLPEQFTLSELQHVYEMILRRSLDKRNFRKKILAAGLIEATGAKRRESVRHRPANLYRFCPPQSEKSRAL